MRITLSRKAIILVTIPLVFELLFVSVLLVMMHQLDGERAREAQARDLTTHLNIALRLILQRGTSIIIHHATDNPASWKRAVDLSTQIKQETATVDKMIAQSDEGKRTMANFNALLSSCNDGLEESQVLSAQGEKNKAALIWIGLAPRLDRLCNMLEQAVVEQQTIQVRKKESLAQLRMLIEIAIYAGIAFNIILAVCLVSYFNRGTSQRLDVLMDNSYRLATQRELSPPLDGDDELAHLDQTFRAMSKALIEMRRRETAVLEKAVDVICSINPIYKFITVNAACSKQWGIDPDTLISKHIRAIVAAEDLDKVLQQLASIKQDSASESTFECTIISRGGERKPSSWSTHWSNEEKCFFCVVHDISERVALEKMKNDFLAMASHDLRVPLTSIQMVHELLLMGVYGEVTEPAKQKLSEAQVNTKRLLGLIHELLEMERLESGSLDLNIAPTCVDDIIGSAIKSVAGLAEQQNVILEVEPHDNFKLSVDSDKMVQVMVNLLSNAIKFSPVGEKVTVQAAIIDGEVKLAVTDRGEGVPPDLQQVIFEKFKTFSGANNANKSGTGLGLAICKLLMQRHGGEIGLSVVNGAGTTFFVKLPATVLLPA